MNAKNRKLMAFGLFVLGLAGLLHSLPSQVKAQRGTTLNLDVACDCRTFSFNRGISFVEVLPGDTFIVRGGIFPAGTLPEGAATNDPNAPGSIGNWTCRGTQAVSFADAIAGVQPAAFITQYHLLNDGRGLVSDGPTGEPEGLFAVTGGLGSFSGAGGNLTATIIGTNATGCPNIRFAFNLTKQAPK